MKATGYLLAFAIVFFPLLALGIILGGNDWRMTWWAWALVAPTGVAMVAGFVILWAVLVVELLKEVRR